MNTADKIPATEQEGTCNHESMARAMQLLGDVCTLTIVYSLLSGTRRFGELLEAMGNVSPKTLSHRLKILEEIGFLNRQAYPEIPPRVEYSLTAKGQDLADIMNAIKQFGERYLSDTEPVSGCEASSEDAV